LALTAVPPARSRQGPAGQRPGAAGSRRDAAGTAPNHAWLKRRTAALNLRNLIEKGLARRGGAWVLATDQAAPGIPRSGSGAMAGYARGSGGSRENSDLSADGLGHRWGTRQPRRAPGPGFFSRLLAGVSGLARKNMRFRW
jgi:hypothetical protein